MRVASAVGPVLTGGPGGVGLLSGSHVLDPDKSKLLIGSIQFYRVLSMRVTLTQNPLVWFLALILLSALPAFAEQPRPQQATREDLAIDPAMMMKPWKGDLDGMINRKVIRVLSVNSKTFYFQDKGVQRGATYDFLHLFG